MTFHHRSYNPSPLDSYLPLPPLLPSRQAPPMNVFDQLHPSPHLSDRRLPKVGETRCYWTLLSADLNFIYLDPVLSHHLSDQADSLIGKSLLDFVHPDEQASAKHDLGNVLQSRTLHGSVTRMRYSRLSRVRRLLGHHGPTHEWPDADKVAVDSNYMVVDLVINWAADGLALCFHHAVVDLTPFDNDEHVKTGWSNWCGTNVMNEHEAHVLYTRLLNSAPQSASMSRVFQIMMNTHERPLLLSWPPGQDHGPTSRDFAKLSEEVQIGNSVQVGGDAKTSCTRRYKSLQNMPSSDGVREVESIFIPHGTLPHPALLYVSSHPRSSSDATSMQQASYDPAYMTPQGQYYDDQSTPYALPPMQPSNASYSSYLPQPTHQVPSQYPTPRHWSSAGVDQSPPPMQYNHWPAATSSPNTFHATPAPARASSYPQQQQWTSQSPSYLDSESPLASSSYRSLSPAYSYAPEQQHASPPSGIDMVPPTRMGQRRETQSAPRDHYANGGRSSGNPPLGIVQCSSCKVTQSPEWRKGPSGKKDLCNACGLRYARSRAKKEGITAQRRRKDKVLAMAKQEPSAPIAVPYRGSYDAGGGSPGGSASGSDAYAPFESPSPPPRFYPSPLSQPYGRHRDALADVRHAHGKATYVTQ
ncbi:hypothetical protein BV25DRAFT_1869046 [Artomyces pyxidatus]|uniref:Uncharacterized protein n=1 Tax=Artomyces pyxidatus TaxID=48021 RepID=A0ACB8T9W7_9AGAM|nr:hypothetical protein BV25DRAFT_1869046 [Artomyces pyxidatus]